MITIVRVSTQSVTHVAESLIGIVQIIVTDLGLGPDYIHENLGALEAGLTTWLEEKSLEAATLEIFTPAGSPVTRLDLQISYGSFLDDERQFYSDLAAARIAVRKLGTIAVSCRYRIVVSTKDGRTPVPGWSSTTFLSTDGMHRRAVGDLIGSPDIRSSLAIWIK